MVFSSSATRKFYDLNLSLDFNTLDLDLQSVETCLLLDHLRTADRIHACHKSDHFPPSQPDAQTMPESRSIVFHLLTDA